MRLSHLELSLRLSRQLCFKVEEHIYSLTIRKVVKIDDKISEEAKEETYKRQQRNYKC